uniref:CUB domain containing protein 1 n=1 Tax=Echeneis naucrates TaxID=173247 RepID=A0A665VQK7_ECHNA
MLAVTPDPNTNIIIIRKNNEPDCTVCMDTGPKQKCNLEFLRITDPRNTSVEFSCPQPQDIYDVEINREIDCTETSCSGNIVQTESSLFPDFNRTFTWDFKVVSTRAFQLDFPETGMKQISNEDACPDDHTYTVVTYLRSGPATIGTFCKGGPVTTILARYKGRVSLKVPADAKLNPVDFKVTVGPETNSKFILVAIVKVNLPRGVSNTDFITANYPNEFPDNQKTQWDFTVPGMHNYTVQFGDHTTPECLSGDVQVEYNKGGKKVTKLSLTDPQPQHQQGNFNMVLKNCETNRTLQGLSLKYRVSVMRSGHPVLCTVDLTKHQGVSLQVEKLTSDPNCELSINSKVEEKLNVAAGTKADLSFLDCPSQDVRLTASQVIACQNVASCSASVLTVPKLDSCLPMPLHSFSWHLNIPRDGTVDLVSPTGTLQQSVPGHRCNQPVLLHVAEEDGFSVGDFCFNGTIQKLQVHANVSITATAHNFSKTTGPLLNANFSQEIPETIIYRVSPGMLSPTVLATPNWPEGMKPSSTVSWIVNVPSQYQALVQFANVSQPKCLERHTAMIVKKLGYEEELMSRREDEEPEKQLLIPQSFYLNMSNCIPESGNFGAFVCTSIKLFFNWCHSLTRSYCSYSAYIFSNRKKRDDKKNKASSIYIGGESIFRPGDKHFTKSRPDNNSHVYASIDEMMVYGHLLNNSSYADSMQDHFTGIQVDSYNTFTGPTNGEMPVIKEPDHEPEMDQYKTFLAPSETFIPSRPRTPIDRQDSLGFQDRRMVDNELYTFKSTGEINTIRLSGADMEPQPPITEESL